MYSGLEKTSACMDITKLYVASEEIGKIRLWIYQYYNITLDTLGSDMPWTLLLRLTAPLCEPS